MGRESVSDELGGVAIGKVLAFGGVEVQLPIFGPADATVLEFWRISWRFRGAMSLTSSA